MSEIKVNSIKGVSASSAAISVDNSSGSATANLTTVNSVTMPNGGFLSNRNMVINGNMFIAQLGTSSTSGGYQTVDRHPVYFTGGAVTQSQQSLSSGAPFDIGFTKYLRLTNSTANSGTDVARSTIYKMEAQDVRNSGWNYKSSSSYITISFWVRSSVSQQFYMMVRTQDGTSQAYPFSLGTLSADTWTKVTHSIPGNTNLQFDDDNDRGLEFFLYVSLGTDFTSSSVSLNAWGAYSSSARLPDYTNSWSAATNATFDLTGYQVEVGSVATEFEYKSFTDELKRCHRYLFIYGFSEHNSDGDIEINFIPVDMRALPTVTRLGNVMFGGESSTSVTAIYNNAGFSVNNQPGSNLILRCINSSDANCGGCYSFSSEL